jgi:hypothetical protein
MTVTDEQLGSFASLATAIGLMRDGSPQPSWFESPLGNRSDGSFVAGLTTMLADDTQRDALVDFVDEVLGPPDREQEGDDVWVPLFRESDPPITISAVLTERPGSVRVGIGAEYEAGTGTPRVTTKVHVPIFQFRRRTGALEATGPDVPDWLLLGGPHGNVGISLDVVLDESLPPPGEAALGAITVDVSIPTSDTGSVSFAVGLQRLQLPGAPAPTDHSLDVDSIDDLGSDVLELILGLVRAQAEALDLSVPELRPFAALTGLLGLRAVPDIPAFPIVDLVTNGIDAVVDWIATVLDDDDAHDAWLGQLATLIGATPDPANDSVVFTIGDAELGLGVRIDGAVNGLPVLTPWIEIGLDTSAARGRVEVGADLFRLDTATGEAAALPVLRAEAVFGTAAGAAPLLAGDPAIGGVRLGVGLRDGQHPEFRLTLHDVTLNGRPHDVIDLSSPEAALDAANDVVDDAIVAALDGLGPAGGAVATLIGLDPPTGITGTDATALLTDPLGALAAYWDDLAGSDAAMRAALRELADLLLGGGASAVPGTGTAADPWIVALAGPVAMAVHRTTTATGTATLHVALTASADVAVFDDHRVHSSVRLDLVRAHLATRSLDLLLGVGGELRLEREDDEALTLELGDLSLTARHVAVDVAWRAGNGATVAIAAPDLLVTAAVPRRGAITVAVPLPTIAADGSVDFAPNWDDVERALGLLLHRADAPFVSAMVELVGWYGDGPRLSLGGLVADPEAEVRRWAADLALDCERVRNVLAPVSNLLNGLRGPTLTGQGTPRHPFRCAPAGVSQAPGLAVWLEPGCPLVQPPNRFDTGRLWSSEPLEPAELAAILARSGTIVPSIGDLLVARNGLAEGLELLRQRWIGTDGLVAAPASLPDGVDSVVVPGVSYTDLVTRGATGELIFDVLDPVPTALVHVGVEPELLADRPAGTTFDASGADSSVSTTGALPATGDGEWFVRLPDTASATTLRADRDAIAAQRERLAAVLGDRTAPITVVVYGDAGAAALRLAPTATAIEHVVTVGVPWGPVAVDSLGVGLSGDALRLLTVLDVGDAGDAETPPDEITPGTRGRHLVRRSVAALDAANRPASARDETLRPGLAVTAVFGALDEDTIDIAVGHLLGEAVDHRIAAGAAAPFGRPTSLHAGVSLPPVDLDLAGLLVGAGATFEACRIERTASGQIDASLARSVIVDLRLGVHDGWLVGGPGATQSDLQLRWMDVRVTIPLDDRPAGAVLTFHEATTYGVFRERWEVGPDDLTVVVPEARALVSQVITRLRTQAPDLADLFSALGLIRDGGLDPAALDRWVYDTRQALDEALATDRAAVASALRRLIGDTTGTGTTIGWSASGATVSVDLATGRLTGGIVVDDPALPSVDVGVTADAAGAALTAAVGSPHPERGGTRLVASASTATGPSLAVEVTLPGAPAETLSLLSPPDPGALAARLADHAADLVVAAVGGRVIDDLRRRVGDGADALDQALDLLGLLGAPGPLATRSTMIPIGLVTDPLAWMRHAVDAWRTNFAASAVGLLDAVGTVVAGSAGLAAGSWAITAELAVTYSVVGDRLRLLVAYADEQSLGASTITTSFGAGLAIGLDAPPVPAIDIAVTIGGTGGGSGVRLVADPSPRLDLVRPSPALPITLYPGAGSFGDIVSGAGAMVAPLVLNELAGHRTDPPSTTTDVAAAVFDIGGALGLRDGDDFTAERIQQFALDPGAALLNRLPQLVVAGVDTVVDALDPAGTLVRADRPGPGLVRVAFGAADGASFTLDTAGPTPAFELACNVTIPGVGPVVVERIRITNAGAQIDARFGPAEIPIGPVTLFPLVVVRVGIGSGEVSRVVGVGLASTATGDASLEFRWTLDARPPQLVLVERTSTVETLPDDPAAAALQLLGWAVALAGGIVVELLDDVLTDDVAGWLRGVVFEDADGSRVIDTGLFGDLLSAQALLDRLLRLAWNIATVSQPSLEIDDTVTIGLTSSGSGASTTLGLTVSLVPDKPFVLASGETNVELVVNASFIDPEKAPGLTINLLRGSMGDLEFAPGVIVAGLGVRVSKGSGPLLDLGGVAIDAIAVHTYGEATPDGEFGGGVELQLDGFAFSPAAGGGDNGVANSIMNDAGETGAANRPSFDPALSIQIHPGDSGPRIGVRAGDPPGPWWLIVQRQLGPLYIDRVGLDTVESGGRVTRISLLFDGSISMFGLAAAVEQLSLNWNGGDVLAIESWSVDLMGLAVSADLSGVYLAGGLLKTIDPPPGSGVGGPTTVSYVGMLMGRFGVYGLSVFGGYTDDNGSPSFFIFGAVNGPIGGPPAFFLTGIGGGLGINRGLRVPDDLSRFGEYPFIQALDPAASPPDDPMDQLRELTEYFPPQPGNFWFAAGISFTSFALVDGIAVVAVSFGDGLDINLFGLARLALPRPQVALVSIELGILARFSTSEGLFLIQAQLTDNSWLLYPEVRLTGGFAMAIWWKGALAGQFVLTLGGYHPDFHRDGYPVVPRLGLEWRISNAIVIKGGSYFALTSEALMAGVDVEVSADWGWAWVRVAFGAHAIVFFDPFYFQAEVYARISAGIEIDVWIGTISISISIGARISVEGPDFSGRATFEIGPCELSVAFGDPHKEKTPAIDWEAFVVKYLEDAGGGTARAISSVTGRGTLPAATDGEVGAPSSDGTLARPFEVFAEHEIVFVTTVPTTRFTVGNRTVAITPTTPDGSTVRLGIAPMEVDDVTSTLSVKLQMKVGSIWQDLPTATVSKLADGLAVSSTDRATPHVRTDAYPLGVWGEAEDPDHKPLPKGDIVRAGQMIKLVAGIAMDPVGPEIDYRQVEAGRRPLPLSASGSRRPDLLAAAGTLTIPVAATAAEAFDVARHAMFDVDGSAAQTAGVLPRGRISETSRRAFAADRTAPPRFGTLAGGITAANGDRAAVEPAEVRPAPTGARLRDPVVIGHLAAGTGAIMRSAGTTVADRRIKRRSAPSTRSVQGRLGNELALSLDRVAPAGIVSNDTLLLAAYPRTDGAGAHLGTVGGRYSGAHLATLVGGLRTGPRSRSRAGETTAIRPGDVVVIEQTDARIDVGASRPAYAVAGRARMVMVRSNGRVLTDVTANDEEVIVPPGTRLVAVQADPPRNDGPSALLAGWHGRSRLARLGVRSALGAGCVIRSDSTGSARTGWVQAHDVVADATVVSTAFTDPAAVIALVFDDVIPDDLDTLSVSFSGCQRNGVAGRPDEPTVVVTGSQSVVLVEVTMDESVTDDRNASAPAFTVDVRAGGAWRLAGVLAAEGSVDAFADRLAGDGVDAATGRLDGTSGPGCTVEWHTPTRTRRMPIDPRRGG